MPRFEIATNIKIVDKNNELLHVVDVVKIIDAATEEEACRIMEGILMQVADMVDCDASLKYEDNSTPPSLLQ